MLKFPENKHPEENDFDFFNRIHSWALSIFEYHTDLETWGLPDYWATIGDLQLEFDINNKIKGDCDDFAQLCRYAAMACGIPSRLVLCYTELGDYHCVAEIESGWIFDNRESLISHWTYLLGKGYKKDVMGPICDPNEPYLKGTDSWHKAL
jgi:predicted transglutaminase-like cysteine proteinase